MPTRNLKLLLSALFLLPFLAMNAAFAQSDTPSTATLSATPQEFHVDSFTSRTLSIAGPMDNKDRVQTGFFHLQSLEQASYRTDVTGWYDDKAVWFIIRAYGKTLPELKKDFVGRDTDVWQDDSIEVFLRPPGNVFNYWHVIVNPAGGILDEYRPGQPMVMDRSYNIEGLRASIIYDYEWWQVDLSIPFDSVGMEIPEPGDQWRINFTRYVPVADGEDEWSTWTPINHNSFHAPEMFGVLTFEENAAAISFDQGTDIDMQSSGIDEETDQDRLPSDR